MVEDKLHDTLVAMFHRRVEQDGEQTAIHFRQGETFVSRTWNELARDARRTTAVLVELGVKPADRVIQVSENRYEWIVFDIAVHMAHAIHVAVHSTLTGPQIAFQIQDSGAKLVVISGPEQAEKLAAARAHLPPDVRYLSYDACDEKINDQPVGLLPDLVEQASEEQGQAIAQRALAETQPTDLATILYTSGTTGDPKGVMLSHRNLTFNARAVLEIFKVEPNELRLTWLPLSHIYARTSDLYLWIAAGGEIALSPSRETIIADCQVLRPHYINGVPYFYDKVMRTLQEKGVADQPGVLAATFGGRIKLACAGGAALPDYVNDFYEKHGVLLVQGYGLTESSPVISTGTPEHHRIGTVGRPIPGIEVKIADDGEILTRGPHVMEGYWKLPDDTAQSIEDGWLHTGDLGSLEDGYLKITGRKKELIVTAGGKNIAPTYLEGLLSEDNLIAQVVVIGDARNFLTALIVPDPDALRGEIIKRQIPVLTPAQALAHPDVHAIYHERIKIRLSEVSHAEQIQKFTLLSRGMTPETGEMTFKLSLRRDVIMQNFAAEIEAMYSG